MGINSSAAANEPLGITAIELLPVHEFANDLNTEGSPGWDRSIDEPPHGNYWGYMPLNFFSPHHGYLSNHAVEAQHNEFREMIKALHQARHNKTRAAKLLGLTRAQLYSRIEKYGLAEIES